MDYGKMILIGSYNHLWNSILKNGQIGAAMFQEDIYSQRARNNFWMEYQKSLENSIQFLTGKGDNMGIFQKQDAIIVSIFQAQYKQNLYQNHTNELRKLSTLKLEDMDTANTIINDHLKSNIYPTNLTETVPA